MNNRSFGWILISTCLLLLSGCAPLVRFEQPAHTGWVTLDAEHSIGQTFTARYAGLEAIAFLLEPGDATNGSLEFSLFAHDQRTTPLETVRLPLNEIQTSGFQRINFSALPLSNQQDYYLRMIIIGEGAIQVGIGPGAGYLNGAAYTDDIAQDQQVVFRLIYNRNSAVRGLIQEGIGWLLNLSVAGILFIIPGWGILTAVYPGWRRLFWPEKLGLAAGVSLVIYPVLVLWTNLIGLQAGMVYAWLPVVAGISLIIWSFARQPHSLNEIHKPSLPDIFCSLTYIGIMGIILISRLWPVRGLAAPMWGDSLHHTLISQLIVDHQGLFTTWAPYAEMTSFTYHFGFHTLTAAYHWLTGMELSQAVLWTGQIMNILSLIVLVPLSNRLNNHRWAGVFALTIAGLLTSIPQVYVNWGRYTQLTGQIILLVLVYLSWVYFHDHPGDRRLGALVAILLAGLGLTHNRILVFAVAFFLVYFFAYARSTGFWRSVKIMGLVSLGGLLIFLPWLLRVFPSTISQILFAQISTPANQLSASVIQGEDIFQYAVYVPAIIWYLSGAALLLAILRRDKAMLAVSCWWLLVLLIGYPHWIGLPGSGAIGGFTVMIAAYIPVSLLTGYLLSSVLEYLRQQSRLPGFELGTSILVSVLTLGIGLSGLRARLLDVHVSESALFTRADQRAAEWIREHLPHDSLILVNSFLAYDNTVAVGSDGGWWLPFKAQRAVTLPPINYSLETGPDPEYRQRVNQITSAILEKGIMDPAVQDLLAERGVTHIYLGQQQGSVNYAGPPILAEQLLSMGSYHPVYHEDRVWVFERIQP